MVRLTMDCRGGRGTLNALLADVCQLWQLRRLLATMTRREIGARFAGSVGGWLWAWLPPLVTIAAYFLVFDIVFGMRLGDNAPTSRVGTYLVVGMTAWMAFADAAQRGMMSLIESGGMLQKNPLPPALFPARAVMASSVVFAPLMLLLLPAYVSSHHFRAAVWVLPVLMLLQAILTFLLAYLLAIMAAALRDVVQVIGVLLSLGIFLSPILFPLSLFPARFRWLLWFNPMTALVVAYQSVLLQGQWPPLQAWLVLLAWIALTAALLSVAIRRSRDELVDWL